MFYEPKNGYDLPHNPFNAIVTPRPIGWISTRGKDGIDNLAPYSFFNATAYVPPQVMFASTGNKPDRGDTKDSVGNIRETGVFCVNIVQYDMRDAMNASSQTLPADRSEFDHAGLERVECSTIPCARVAGVPAALECIVTDIVPLRGQSNTMVMGEVTGIYMRDDCLKDGVFDITSYQPLTRLGYRDYSRISDLFALARPDD